MHPATSVEVKERVKLPLFDPYALTACAMKLYLMSIYIYIYTYIYIPLIPTTSRTKFMSILNIIWFIL